MQNLDRALSIVTNIAVFGAMCLAVIDTFFADFLPQDWYIVGIFATLFALVVNVGKLPSLQSSILSVESKISVRGFEKFENHKLFYESLEKSVKAAKSELLLTHIRQDPPANYKGGASYFTYIENWAKSHPHGIVKRLGTDCNADMKEWSDSQYILSEGVDNFYFRTVPWSTDFPFLNMAIVDRREVYVAISTGEVQSTKALKFDDVETAQFLVDYYNFIWAHAK